MITTKKPIVVNLYGGPGTGKSTTAAGTFYKLKTAGVNCELVTEYAKSKVWEDAEKVLHDQLYVFGKQNHRMEVLRRKVDVIVTDSPILLSLIYGGERSLAFKMLVTEQHLSWNNVDIFLQRVKPYNPIGRLQTLDEAKSIDDQMKEMFKSLSIKHLTVVGDENAPDVISKMILEKLRTVEEEEKSFLESDK